MSKIYVVVCIDTEGPFIDPNYHNPKELFGSWKEIDKNFLSIVFSKKYRYTNKDSNNQPLIFSWFILNWTGFRTYPVKHDIGYFKVFDHYLIKWGGQIKSYNDEINWHYHHPPLSGLGNEWGVNWFENYEYNNILCKLLIDREYFPICFRSGGTIETNDQSHWLEQWIPFDYSNRNGKYVSWDRKEADGRTIKQLTRWYQSPNDWSFFHPSHENYAIPGNMKRIIARSLDIKSGSHTLQEAEIKDAFHQASKGKETIISLFEHDFRDRAQTILEAIKLINNLSKEYQIPFYFAGAANAIKKVLNLEKNNNFKLSIKITKRKILITSNRLLFNNQPFLAIKYSNNLYRWLPLFKTSINTWEYNLLPEDKNKKIGIAAHDENGNTFIKVFTS